MNIPRWSSLAGILVGVVDWLASPQVTAVIPNTPAGQKVVAIVAAAAAVLYGLGVHQAHTTIQATAKVAGAAPK